MEVVLGIDMGTSYFKLGLFDRKGELRGLGRIAVLPDGNGAGGRCELPIDRFWMLLSQGLADACAQASVQPADIRAVAYSSQANSFVLLDERNNPLTPLVLWPDRRVKLIDPALLDLSNRNDFLGTTGLGLSVSSEFCLAKLLWFRQHEPDVWKRISHVMTISDYLVFALTNRTVGDAGTASLLGILALSQRRWWEDGMRALGLQPAWFATPLLPGSPAGEVHHDGSRRLGLAPGIPVAVGSLDHHIAAIGAGVGSVADFSESTGTVLACLRCSNVYRPKPGCCMGPGLDAHSHYTLVFDDNGAKALEWYQKTHAPQLSIPQLVQEAGAVTAGSEGLVALPSADKYPGLEGFRGRCSSHGPGHFVRALMESTAASLATLVGTLSDADRPKRIVATGGGARSDLWLQIKADLLGIPFVTTSCSEPACMGAAMLAAVTAGWAKTIEEAASAWISVKREFLPQSSLWASVPCAMKSPTPEGLPTSMHPRA
jgi:sugar (pentulose or hexulose) kinase